MAMQNATENTWVFVDAAMALGADDLSEIVYEGLAHDLLRMWEEGSRIRAEVRLVDTVAVVGFDWGEMILVR